MQSVTVPRGCRPRGNTAVELGWSNSSRLGVVKHQSDVAAPEKRERTGVEQELESEARRVRRRRRARRRAHGSLSHRRPRSASACRPPGISLAELTVWLARLTIWESTPLDPHEVADRVHSAAHPPAAQVFCGWTTRAASPRLLCRRSQSSRSAFDNPRRPRRCRAGERADDEQARDRARARRPRGARTACRPRPRGRRGPASPKGRAILRRGRERRIGELAALLDDLAPSDLETLAEASRIVEDVSALRHPPAVRMLAIPRKGGGPT